MHKFLTIFFKLVKTMQSAAKIRFSVLVQKFRNSMGKSFGEGKIKANKQDNKNLNMCKY